MGAALSDDELSQASSPGSCTTHTCDTRHDMYAVECDTYGSLVFKSRLQSRTPVVTDIDWICVHGLRMYLSSQAMVEMNSGGDAIDGNEEVDFEEFQQWFHAGPTWNSHLVLTTPQPPKHD